MSPPPTPPRQPPTTAVLVQAIDIFNPTMPLGPAIDIRNPPAELQGTLIGRAISALREHYGMQ